VLGDQERVVLIERALHVLAAAGMAALVQRRQYRDRAEHAAHHVVDGRAGAQRAVAPAGHVGESPHHLHDLVEPGAALIRAGKEALERAINESGIHLAQRLLAESQLVHRAGLEVLGHHVRARDELQHGLAPARRLDIDGEALLVAVVSREEARAGGDELAGMIAVGRLDLDDLGTQVGEDQPAGRPHHHVAELRDPDALEGQLAACVVGHAAAVAYLPPARTSRMPRIAT
jgi:hypothetical protein